ncbi:MAG: hypothetical protein B6D35_14340 [Candidatus Brocadia sp. UTAMX2]|jgi:hypothetical protein|nr:MAG: hypothetical protein B6D35_14340 [Candidatus Brocadia sp. UTAMX2]
MDRQHIGVLDKRIAVKKSAEKLLKEYFGDIKTDAYANYQLRYWQEIFKDELEIVKGREETKALNLSPFAQPPMIMTLGASPEPLVLAVHLVKPGAIYVIYNQEKHLEAFERGLKCTDDNADTFVKKLKPIKLAQSHREAADLFKLFRGKQSPGDDHNSRAHLKELLEIIRDTDKRKEIVLDVTGAKKTISTGCFLFAAYAGISVYYMDFDNTPDAYHPDLGKPYPGNCFYTKQTNPVSAFAIEVFNEIETAFDAGRFHDVFKQIGKIIQVMDNGKKEGFFEQREIDLLFKMAAVSDVYADWQDAAYGNNGDGKNLHERLLAICDALNHPVLLNKLSDYPSSKKVSQIPNNVFYYQDVRSFCSYVTIELARLRRKSDFSMQHVFLKVFCLEEFMVGFIWWNLLDPENNDNIMKEITFRNDENPDKREELNPKNRKSFVNGNYGMLEEFLVKDIDKTYEKKDFKLHYIKKTVVFKRKPITDYFGGDALPEALWKFRGNRDVEDEETITRQKRNKAAHFTTYVAPDQINTLLEAAENIWKFLLEKKKDWFVLDGHGLADEYLKIMSDRAWYKRPEVAPLAWNTVKDVIEKDMKDAIHKTKKGGDYK